MSANFDVPMAGVVEIQWNLGESEDGEIEGRVDLVQDGKRKEGNRIAFNRSISQFSDDNMDQATQLTLALLWRDDLKPLLHSQLFNAFVEMRERMGGFTGYVEPE